MKKAKEEEAKKAKNLAEVKISKPLFRFYYIQPIVTDICKYIQIYWSINSCNILKTTLIYNLYILSQQKERDRQRSASRKLTTESISDFDKRRSISERSPGEFDDLISALRTGDVFGDEIFNNKAARKRGGKPRNHLNAPKKMSIVGGVGGAGDRRDRRVDQDAIAEMLQLNDHFSYVRRPKSFAISSMGNIQDPPMQTQTKKASINCKVGVIILHQINQAVMTLYRSALSTNVV